MPKNKKQSKEYTITLWEKKRLGKCLCQGLLTKLSVRLFNLGVYKGETNGKIIITIIKNQIAMEMKVYKWWIRK